MLSQNYQSVCIQCIDKVNTPCYNTGEYNVYTPEEGSMIEQILIRAPRELKEWIKAESERLGITMNALMLQIMWESKKKNASDAEVQHVDD